ncbi:MAG: NAD(P)/FAD-dependent oxidoreductase [Planctomycetes bacterium]|nr:NAD(P)/FAD-dependent oxidoreductase [Planctomycetota bacterium]
MLNTTIVVGSGISGLAAAIVLARHGRRVLVLERHTAAGGCMQHFRRRGPAGPLHFDVGVHYVGSMKPGQLLWRLLRYLGATVTAVPLREDGFDRISLPGIELDLPVGWPALAGALKHACPGEDAAIDIHVRRMQAVEASLNWHALNPDAEGAYDRELFELPLSAWLDSLRVSPRLRGLLCSQSSLYGVPSGRVPLAVHAPVVGSALEGPCYIRGGGAALVQGLVSRLRELGGEVRTRCAVHRALVHGEQASGVELETGETLPAAEVILALHPVTAAAMMPPDAWRGALQQRMAALQEGVGLFAVYGWVEGGAGELAGRNYYLLRENDPDCYFRPSRDSADAIVNLPPPEAGVQPFVAMGSAGFEWFAPWAASRPMQRGAGYAELKEHLCANVLSRIEQRLPALAGRLRVVETASPLTLRDYVGYPRGGIYGIEPSLAAQGRNGVRRRTRYRGLYVTGAGTGTPGILGACVTGFAVAGSMLGTEDLIRAVRRETDP